MEHSRFVIETMSFCQGNCQGCFFSKEERTTGSFVSKETLNKILNFILEQSQYLKDFSVNFGQGDHLSLSENEWDYFLNEISRLQNVNPLITITTSAIEDFEKIKQKVDKLHSFALNKKMKLFFAVVLDPKKLEHLSFRNRYIKNINYIREKFGFIDLTINVGKDTLDFLSPVELSNFLIENKFRHIELNLIPTINTLNNFKDYPSLIKWFIDFRKVSEDKSYLVYHHYHFNELNKKYETSSLIDMTKELNFSLNNNFYIDSDMNVSSILSGFTGNAIPISAKTGYLVNQSIHSFHKQNFAIEQKKIASKLFKEMINDNSCNNCDYKNICLMSGSMIFKNREYASLHRKDGCFLGVDKLWSACANAKDTHSTGVSFDLLPKGLSQINAFGEDDIHALK